MLILKLNLKHAKNYTKIMCDALRDLVPFVKFGKKHEKRPLKSTIFSKVAGVSLQFF